MIVIKWSDKLEGYGDNIDSPLCGGLYNEEENSLVPWSGTDPDAKINCFTWSKEENDWIAPRDQYNEGFKNWKVPIHNSQSHLHNLKHKIRTEKIRSKFSGSVKFNWITREGNTEIFIKYCND